MQPPNSRALIMNTCYYFVAMFMFLCSVPTCSTLQCVDLFQILYNLLCLPLPPCFHQLADATKYYSRTMSSISGKIWNNFLEIVMKVCLHHLEMIA